MRRKAAEAAAAADSPAVATPARSRASQTWAMLIKRVYEVDPLLCAKCGGTMKVIAFLEPPQGEVIERILKHCGLWRDSSPRPPPEEEGLVYVPEDEGSDTADYDLSGELALVADPDWDSQPQSEDVPWEVTCDSYGDSFDASF
jgi:hypothetical protein